MPVVTRHVSVLGLIAFLCALTLTGQIARSAECDDIHAGARRGPPSDWSFWGFGPACHVRWALDGGDDESRLLNRCRHTLGARFVHFESDFRAGHVTCIFKLPNAASSAVDTEPATIAEQALEPRPANEPKVISAIEDIEAEIAPVSEDNSNPDPNRIKATAHCSSIVLGDRKNCVDEAQRVGKGSYSFGLDGACSRRIAAAITTIDDRGRCVRQVIRIAPGDLSPPKVRSQGAPSVLDAILAGDNDTYACYLRRHNNISCDGKTNYNAR